MARRRRGGRAGVRAMRREHEERQQQQELEEKQQQQQLDDNDDDARRLPSPAPSDIAEPDAVEAAAAVNRARTPSPVSAAPVHLSQLDADSLDSELAKTDAKLRRLLVRKERLELRRTQLSVTAMHWPPSTVGAAATDIIDHADADPAVANDEDIAWGHAPVSLATTTASPLSPSPTDTTGTSLALPRPYESTVPRRARRVSHTSSTDSANGSALSTSPTATAPAVFPSHSSDSSESGGNEVDAMAQLQQDLEDDRDDVLSALSDDSDLASSFISDLSLGSDFSLLSEARYGRPAA
ncbi:hypothetical protein AMAG_09527 [Allomyces macrogynus ATCC 38327]|uniref:Uncharacterized protein n=1 Tax=Allomyces macrogynus (strain ATCC 38327) TaxID=578462 RepID=A0A0L0SPR4_ALLM3|nr:hypothetical protein AMAG_09527 [Allomyces macrogynus ATCC 38327]|eukprot:KNE64513.1 hypothetical protein AMAG_09527 [Allomyces macrogynus ATCC 38327]